VTLTFAAIILVSIFFLYRGAQSELAPVEDQSFLLTSATLATDSSIDQANLYGKQIRDIAMKHPELQHIFQVMAPNNIFSGLVLKPWDQRKTGAVALTQTFTQELSQVAGAQIGVFPPPSLPGAFGLPIQVAIGTTQPFEQLQPVADAFLGEALKSGAFMFLMSDLKINFPEGTIEIDRNKAAQLGMSMTDVGNALASLLGGGYVNYFSLAGRSYRVIPQIQQRSRLNAQQLMAYSIRTPSGAMVPLSTIAKITTRAIPASLNHFQQLNSATIQGVAMPGVSLGDAIKNLQDIGARVLPQGYYLDYGGQARQYIQESSGFLITFGFALIVIFLALAALFESFRDPVIILVSVPMSIAGALIFISLGVGGASLNIYTEVGLVTLMGVISKHGILLVEFANEAQKRGLSKLEAIEEAASIRFRPILMTTAAMVFGVFPLIIASGAGAAARFSIGIVVASGIAIGTLFTLFVVPAVYLLLAAQHRKAPVTSIDAAPDAQGAPAE
jgi:multidrug efflux pump